MSGDSWAPAGGTRPRRAASEHKRTSRRTRHGSAKRKKGKGGEAGRSLNPCPFVERSATPGGAGPKRLRAPRGAKAEREAAAKPPRPHWGLGLLARLRERPIFAPQERICRRLVSDGATGGRGPPAGDSQGVRPEHGRVHQEVHAKKKNRGFTPRFFRAIIVIATQQDSD